MGNDTFLAKDLQKFKLSCLNGNARGLSCIGIQLHFLKIFISKNASVALARPKKTSLPFRHDWQKSCRRFSATLKNISLNLSFIKLKWY